MIRIKARLSRAIDTAQRRLERMGCFVQRFSGSPFHLSATWGGAEKWICITTEKPSEKEIDLIRSIPVAFMTTKEVWMKKRGEAEFEIVIVNN